MKKWFAIVLASTMILSISTAALAVNPTFAITDPEIHNVLNHGN